MLSLTTSDLWVVALVGMPVVIALGAMLWRIKFVKLIRAVKLENRGTKLISEGHYENAEIILKKSLQLAEEAVGPDDSNVGPILGNLAQVYWFQEKFSEAERMFKRAIPILEKVRGHAENEGHPFLVHVLSKFADMFREQNPDAEVEPPYPEILVPVLNNFADMCREQDRDAEAEPLYQQALSVCERTLPPEHPGVALSLNNLASFYCDHGNYAEAEPLLKRVLVFDENALGPEHPDVATSINKLGLLYDNAGKPIEAEQLYKRALAIREKVFGPEHPDVAQSLNNLAQVYRSQAKHAEAEPLYKRAVAILEKAESPNAAVVLKNYAALLRKTGRGNEAAEMETRVKATQTKHAEQNPSK